MTQETDLTTDGGGDSKGNRNANRQLRFAWVAERVFLAWVRTAIALMAMGFLLARIAVILESVASRSGADSALPREANFMGMALIGVGCLVSMVATWRFYCDRRNIVRGITVEHHSDLAMFVGVVTPVVGVSLITFLWRALAV